MTSPLLSTALPLPVFRKGKVRDVYDLGSELLIVATDRISAFDCIMPNGIPGKGKILTAVTQFWFDSVTSFMPHHVRPIDFDRLPSSVHQQKDVLEGRVMRVLKTEPIAVECVVRGYLAGSAWKEYQALGQVSGHELPQGLQLGSRLPEPLFTPAIKAQSGHDENITFDQMEKIIGPSKASRLKEKSLTLYRHGQALVEPKGILLADTKFEFGELFNGDLILIDEALTPDSSRYWFRDQWSPGSQPASLDKQFLRDYLEEQITWNKQHPAPFLPDRIVEEIQKRYLSLAERLGIAISVY
jgi:phosphoribosylaminoimidazole-succinocarboxamide synthase